jgi:hypothetical protein
MRCEVRTKVLLRWFSVIIPLGVLALILVGVLPVYAQCGTQPPSSCKTCHSQQEPITNNAAWHSDHASQDICVDCHGGNGSSSDKNLAHDNMVAQPLSDTYTDCHSCHPNYEVLAAQYAATLQITPSSNATPTAVVVGSFSSGLPPHGIVMPSNLISAARLPFQPFLFTIGGLAILIVFCFGLGWLDRHHMKG